MSNKPKPPTAAERRKLAEMWPLIEDGVLPIYAADRVGIPRDRYKQLKLAHPELARKERHALAGLLHRQLGLIAEAASDRTRRNWQASAWLIERVFSPYRLDRLDASKLSTEQIIEILSALSEKSDG